MATEVLKSRVRRALLEVLGADPASEWHLRGLAREAGVSVGSAHRELARLSHDGVVTSRRLANLALYRAVADEPIYAALGCGLINAAAGRSTGVASPAGVASPVTASARASLASVLAAVQGLDVAFLWHPPHEHDPQRGLHLCVVGDCGAGAVRDALAAALPALERALDLVVLSAEEMRARARQGERFVVEVLASSHELVAGDEGALRWLLAREVR